MITVHIDGIGLRGPGLEGWAASRPILTGQQASRTVPTVVPPSTLLPANERRRAVQTVSLALAAGSEAFEGSGHDPAVTATVFASSGGDGETIDRILGVLATPGQEISPTRFHNSVHNAPSGYWSIGTSSRAASSSLCAYDDSFAAGLLEAATQAAMERHPVGLIAYDLRYPYPLHEKRPIGAAFAVALVLSPIASSATVAQIGLRLEPGAHAPSVAPDDLEALRQGTPAARSLPLLAALAGATEAMIVLSYLDDMALILELTPA